MRIRSFASRVCGLVLSVSCLVTPAFAAADVAGAQSFVEREHNAIRKMVENNAPKDQVTGALDGMIDYNELARRTLGKPCPVQIKSCSNHWDELSAEQQKEVTTLLRQLVEKNYHKNVEKTRKYDITYRGAKETGDNLAKVRTEAKNKEKPRDPAVQVDYVVNGNGGSYKVIDIVTEGSSMTKNYYDQFHKMLTTPAQGYSYMVEKLKKKIASKNDKKKKDEL